MSKGEEIKCFECEGHGLTCNYGDLENVRECRECNGSGVNWLYESGSLAMYAGGPLKGRVTSKELEILGIV